MYCAKCDKSIKKEKLESIRKELVDRYHRDPLGEGLCPVCGTPLVDVEEARRKKDAR
ncbi:MAG: hypothetical protein LUQ16_00240 [Methanomassiliicoccales archaeon]|jgi:ssDNA-binding Zn-finger/Zn-ribbon topoisomerase 1|nr:hypothetical protein [Methanomassiliicoccales archaeon]MDD1756521.1 hypothetical protein [Methanomassiliicoccales archaeon]